MTRLPLPTYELHTFHWILLRKKWDRMFGTAPTIPQET